MKRVLFLAVLIILSSKHITFAQTTIYSTTTGGYWNESTTWIGNSVPDNSQNVVINGPVVVLNYDNKCLNIEINASKSLYAVFGYYGQLTVFGNIVNNGLIAGAAMFHIKGNLTNNGTWGNETFRIFLTGNDQTITCAENSPISATISATDSSTNIFLGSNLKVIIDGDNVCDFGNAELFTQSHNFIIDEGQFTNARVTSNDTLTFNNTILSSVIINGNYKLKGLLYVYAGNVFKGTATNFGGIINLPGYSTILTVDGEIINYGSIQHSELDIKQNAYNYGTWYNQMTKFIGTNEKTIVNTPGHPYDGVQMRIEDSATTVKCGSDVEIGVDHFFMSNGKFDCNNQNLKINTVFHDGRILNSNNIIQHGYYESVKIEGNAKLYGINNMMYSSLYGTVTNYDTISTAFQQSGNTLKVYGHLINLGKYYNLYMDLFGNLTNHGSLYDNSMIEVKGDIAQSINISSPINSLVRFYSMISGSAYQWMKNGNDISGAQGEYLSFNSLELTDAGVYKCRVIVGGNPQYSREITVNQITGVDEESEFILDGFNLFQNYPNPFNPSSKISWQSPVSSWQTLKVFDVLGNEVATLVDEYKPAGSYEVDFQSTVGSRQLASGVYFYQLRAGSFVETKKMLMIK